MWTNFDKDNMSHYPAKQTARLNFAANCRRGTWKEGISNRQDVYVIGSSKKTHAVNLLEKSKHNEQCWSDTSDSDYYRLVQLTSEKHEKQMESKNSKVKIDTDDLVVLPHSGCPSKIIKGILADKLLSQCKNSRWNGKGATNKNLFWILPLTISGQQNFQ